MFSSFAQRTYAFIYSIKILFLRKKKKFVQKKRVTMEKKRIEICGCVRRKIQHRGQDVKKTKKTKNKIRFYRTQKKKPNTD
jgi:hypothetical protein